MSGQKLTAQVAVRLAPSMLLDLRAVADANEQTVAQEIRRAVTQYLAKEPTR